jgi:hypothetical protein
MGTVCVSDALVAEIKRIVKESEILKYARATTEFLFENVSLHLRQGR